MLSHESGVANSHGLQKAQVRGTLFAKNNDPVYENQIIGMHSSSGDLKVNVCKTKQLTNVRASGKDDATVLHAGGSAHAAVWAGAALPALTDGSALAEEDCAAGHVLGRVSGAHGFRDSPRKGCMTCTVIFCGA